MKKLSFLKNQIEIDTLFKDKDLNFSLKSTFALVGFMWLGLFIFWSRLPPKIPILYSRPWGEEQLLNKSFIVILPSFSTIFTLIALRISSLFFSSSRKPLSYFALWFNFTACLLAFITFWRIIFIVT